MSGHALTRLTCDAPDCEADFGPVPGGITQTRRAAKHNGSGTAYRPDGLPVDLCPAHLAAHEDGRALARLAAVRAARAAGLGNKWE